MVEEARLEDVGSGLTPVSPGWDFVHCPAGTRHTFVGTGDTPWCSS